MQAQSAPLDEGESSTITSAPQRNAPLDGVRGLAVLVVVVHNASWILHPDKSRLLEVVLTLTAAGWVGVQLFFVLSGFLITGTLIDSIGAPNYFRNFYIRRTLRIFPLYYAYLLVALLLVPHVSTSANWIEKVRQQQWWYWTYLSNWSGPFGATIEGLSHFWSLAVEEQFYLLWPLAMFYLVRRRVVVLCVLIVGSAPFIRYVLTSGALPPITAYTFTIARWDALAAGALLMILWREPSGRRSLAASMPWLTGLTLFALLVLFLVQRGLGAEERPVLVLGQSLAALSAAALIYFNVTTSPRTASLQAMFSADWIRFLGKYSYAIYVFHFPIQMLARPYAQQWVNSGSGPARIVHLGIFLAGVLLVSIGAALMSWRLLEHPLLELRERISPRTRGTALADASRSRQ